MKATELDPRGEYVRICPYCGDKFTADHMNREYCPEKGGKKDYCKNRSKRIFTNYMKMVQQNAENDKFDQLFYDYRILQNGFIISVTLNGNNYKKLLNKELIMKGFDYSAYENRFDVAGSEILIFTYGVFGMVKYPDDSVMIMKIRNTSYKLYGFQFADTG